MYQRQDTGVRIKDGLPTGRRALAEALRELHGLMKPPRGSVRQLAERLREEAAYTLNPSTLHRYLSGRYLPPKHFIEKLHALAQHDSGDSATGFRPLSHFTQLHQAAEPTLCGSCAKLRRDVRVLKEEVRTLRKGKCAQHSTKAPPALGSQAGLAAPSSAAADWATHLPVPLQAWDRQQQAASDIAAATQLATKTLDLLKKGEPDEIVVLLRGAAEVLTPLERAASLALLRQQHRLLADSFIGFCGRGQSSDLVMKFALQLHDYGMPDDASAVLRAALK
ncbi:hypothetical protein I5Q34_09630 [Streptomyces sp. AV19]|uniref:hypothetical protein n=1 Tax=Streptomyces sp. AV19 TaxID=2793068 RepID=UPI0018FE6243|nr:hypothetical protein [Streptomyces sp. AV19]MBH1934544.1 hypothetical protein [Streptomyces sp. AV19]MDG4530909.1 hypothetical protein [Streptomyces sp. AV19]